MQYFNFFFFFLPSSHNETLVRFHFFSVCTEKKPCSCFKELAKYEDMEHQVTLTEQGEDYVCEYLNGEKKGTITTTIDMNR